MLLRAAGSLPPLFSPPKACTAKDELPRGLSKKMGPPEGGLPMRHLTTPIRREILGKNLVKFWDFQSCHALYNYRVVRCTQCSDDAFLCLSCTINSFTFAFHYSVTVLLLQALILSTLPGPTGLSMRHKGLSLPALARAGSVLGGGVSPTTGRRLCSRPRQNRD